MAEKQYDVSWPGWNVVGILGYGSYGRVYKIERDVYGHTEKAALKVISVPQNDAEIEELYNDGYDSESITQRFKSHLQDIVREYSLMSEMKGHTNIVYCDDLRCVQHDDGMGWDIYIKMELLTPLPKILVNGFSEDSVIKLALDMCNALILCKSRNIVHRDIKPQNIFVSADGDFKLGDFGIAKTAEHTTSGTKTGTYKYMAPEVYNNQPYGHSADLYSLGMVLYWLLNERRTPFLPLPPKVPTATDEDRARDSRFAGIPIPEPLHGSDKLKWIVLKACAFLPEDRYKSAAEMRKDLLPLASYDIYTSQNQHITYPSENEPGVRTPVTDTDRIQREKMPSEETVGIFVGKSGNKSSTNKKGKLPSLLLGVALCAIVIAACVTVLIKGAFLGKNGEGQTEPTQSAVNYKQEDTHMHSWQEATYEAPQTCRICGATKGTALEKPSVKVNDILSFGHYEQDGIRNNGAEMIEWLVLDVQEGKALLLSFYALDSQPYNNTYGATTWENCTLRSWLNGTFLETAFTEEEKAAILMTEVDNSMLQSNGEWHVKGGNNTEDLIFLLSYADTDRYFENYAARVCTPTNYAVSMGADVRTLDDGITNAAWWWLRSPGEDSNQASFVNFDGTRYTNAVGNGYLSVRPAFWIDLEEYSY